MTDALLLLLRVNLAAAAAVAVVLALRQPARRLFGAGAAYALWSMAPLAALAMVLPARIVTITGRQTLDGAGRVWDGAGAPPHLQAGPAWPTILAGLWIVGGALSLLYRLRQQARVGRARRAGRAGPAVI